MIVRETQAKTILSISKVYDYAINPYTGCQHGCSYCYARFMKRVTAHREPWGEFVDVKTNAPDLLRVEINKKKRGRVWISGVCDPYQPVEAKYKLTRQCLEILAQHNWPVTVQTRSPLVVRDIDILKRAPDFEAGLTITTADDGIRKLFEPHAPLIKDRINALDELHKAGVFGFTFHVDSNQGRPGEWAGKNDLELNDLRLQYAEMLAERGNISCSDCAIHIIPTSSIHITICRKSV